MCHRFVLERVRGVALDAYGVHYYTSHTDRTYLIAFHLELACVEKKNNNNNNNISEIVFVLVVFFLKLKLCTCEYRTLLLN